MAHLEEFGVQPLDEKIRLANEPPLFAAGDNRGQYCVVQYHCDNQFAVVRSTWLRKTSDGTVFCFYANKENSIRLVNNHPQAFTAEQMANDEWYYLQLVKEPTADRLFHCKFNAVSI